MEKFEYPMWFKENGGTVVVKFNSLHGGEIIINDDHFYNYIGKIINEQDVVRFETHTNKNFWIDVTDQYKHFDKKMEATRKDGRWSAVRSTMPSCAHGIPLDMDCTECGKEAQKNKKPFSVKEGKHPKNDNPKALRELIK